MNKTGHRASTIPMHVISDKSKLAGTGTRHAYGQPADRRRRCRADSKPSSNPIFSNRGAANGRNAGGTAVPSISTGGFDGAKR